ncbi:MAG: VWA domain-containing protein [Bacteroidota bacterium]
MISIKSLVSLAQMTVVFLLCITLPLVFAGCGDDDEQMDTPIPPEILGCVDLAATNFDRDANKDDGSCTYDENIFYIIEAFDNMVIPAQRTVQVLFQVTDNDGRGVTDLNESNFRIAENGRLIGTEARPDFSPQEIPIDILTILLLDISSSLEGLIPELKSAAISLVTNPIENQRFALYTFDSDITLLQDFTDNTTLLVEAINSINENNLFNSTNIYGAIQTVAPTWNDERTINQLTDGSIVLFTDGFHNSNSLTVGDALNALQQQSDALRKLYVAALDGPDLSPVPLMQLTDHVPMGFLEIDEISDLSNTFSIIQNEIGNLSNSLYLLDYQSPITDPNSKEESLIIAIIGNSNLTDNGRINTTFNSQGFGN